MATGVYSWSQTAASNGASDAGINFLEGQIPPTFNDSCRQTMARIAQWRDDLAGVKPSNGLMVTEGSANAQRLATNLSAQSLVNGWTISFTIGAGLTNTSACTLSVDSLAAKPVQYISGTALIGGELAAGSMYTATYHQPSDSWILHRAPGDMPSGTVALFFQAAAPVGWTKSTANDNKAIRVVSGTGGVTGGSTAFTTAFGARTIAKENLPDYALTHTLTVASHTHPAGTLSLASGALNNGTLICQGTHTVMAGSGSSSAESVTSQVTLAIASGAMTGSTAAAGGTITGDVNLGGSGTAMDFAVQYMDVIVCVKD